MPTISILLTEWVVRKVNFLLMIKGFFFLSDFCYSSLQNNGASLIAQSGKNLPAMQETQVQFLGQEDPLEKEMATHSIILTWRIPWTEEPGRLQSVRLQESDTT